MPSSVFLYEYGARNWRAIVLIILLVTYLNNYVNLGKDKSPPRSRFLKINLTTRRYFIDARAAITSAYLATICSDFFATDVIAIR